MFLEFILTFELFILQPNS